ncbi:hypothetical protein KQX54_014769 [Cotesia glomerata]|uniref:Transposase-associated domain-containing protein n=1 Tax=Cotesia glomerata TaxID=32391 RepID=A0AAV7IVQ7_COTGL|nr:hypothetical protein KQX54_014769 [Cotesia glomerata]
MLKSEDPQIVSELHQSVDELDIKLKCPCDKCNFKRKLLKEKLKRFEEISEAYNRRNNYRVTIIISEVWDQLKHNVGKFDINVTKQGDNPCLNNPYIYEDLVAHETYNNYIDYLENEMAEENKMVDPFST